MLCCLCFSFSETGSLYVALASLELVMQMRLAPNSQISSCLSDGTEGVCPYTWLIILIFLCVFLSVTCAHVPEETRGGAAFHSSLPIPTHNPGSGVNVPPDVVAGERRPSLQPLNCSGGCNLIVKTHPSDMRKHDLKGR